MSAEGDRITLAGAMIASPSAADEVVVVVAVVAVEV